MQALDNRFEAKEITITAGSTVTWTNDGVNVHDVVPAEGTDFGVKPIDFEPDATYSTTFATPGSYAYYCSLHGSATKGHDRHRGRRRPLTARRRPSRTVRLGAAVEPTTACARARWPGRPTLATARSLRVSWSGDGPSAAMLAP